MTASFLHIIFACGLLSMVAATVPSKVDQAEGSSLVQRRIVVGSGVRRVKPLDADEDLEEDMSDDDDDDNPSLMQAEVCRKKQVKSRLRPIEIEEIDDEMSMLQTEIAITRGEAGDDHGIEEEEEEAFSAMQTSVTVMEGERQVGTARPYAEDDDFDGASFMQNEATFIRKSERVDTSCMNDQLGCDSDDDATDVFSLVQTNVVLNRAGFEEEDGYGIEEEEEMFSAMQTSVTTMAGERHVGTGRPYGEDDDDFDGASFMQNEATFIKKSERADTSCTNGQLDCNSDDDATDVFSLVQTDMVLNRLDGEEDEEDEHLSLVQTHDGDDKFLAKTGAGTDRSKILAWDTILAMDVNTEKDEVKQMASMLQQESSTAKALTKELGQLNEALDMAELSMPEEDSTASTHPK